jgi:hypothetical protein
VEQDKERKARVRALVGGGGGGLEGKGRCGQRHCGECEMAASTVVMERGQKPQEERKRKKRTLFLMEFKIAI